MDTAPQKEPDKPIVVRVRSIPVNINVTTVMELAWPGWWACNVLISAMELMREANVGEAIVFLFSMVMVPISYFIAKRRLAQLINGKAMCDIRDALVRQMQASVQEEQEKRS